MGLVGGIRLDGELGKAKEFYFDDNYWAIRYLVANTGTWLSENKVLISPYALTGVNKQKEGIDISLTKKQIENSPTLETDKPVSRQYEKNYYQYYGWKEYWAGPFMWGYYPRIMHDPTQYKSEKPEQENWDSHLRSTSEVIDYSIQANDGEIGHVEDFIIDEETWAIRYLVIDTKNWWPGKKVIISPQWIERVSWDESKVYVNLSKETIKQSPEYDEQKLLTREYENVLHEYYHRPGYWLE